MIIAKTVSECITARETLSSTVAFVPTMGNLHAGHLSLIEQAKQHADHVVVSIFVNPLQFGPNENFAGYPRTLEQDIEKLKSFDVDVLFTPTEKELYPLGKINQSMVHVPGVSEGLDGDRHENYFSGIATVVAKLFNIVRPNVAVFGLKDYQQCCVIKKMVEDLNFPVKIVLSETVREQDGLAMSSRNRKLSESDRKRAPQLYQSLQRVSQKINGGENNYVAIIDEEKALLRASNFNVDYFEVRHWGDQLVILAAVYLSDVRLIDNFIV